MKPRQRATLERVEGGLRVVLARFDSFARGGGPIESAPRTNVPIADETMPIEIPREFHRRMAAIIEAVQTGLWLGGTREILGYATDFAFGSQRGVQTLVLKTRRRSAYARLDWNSVMGDSAADRQRVAEAVASAIRELT